MNTRKLVDCNTMRLPGTLECQTISRDAIFRDFSGIPSFHKSKLSMKNL